MCCSKITLFDKLTMFSAVSIFFSLGGLILDYGVSKNPGIAVFVPIINGVGGNLAAVQASRISTYLHTSGSPIGTLPDKEKSGCLSPCYTFCSSSKLYYNNFDIFSP